MSTVFAPVPDALKRERLDAYRAFLADRDGEPDFVRRTLSRREEATARLETTPLRAARPFAAATFDAQLRRYDGRGSDELAAILVFVKINSNEAYGVERVTRKPPAWPDVASELMRVVLLEETYHTRMLLSAGALFGVRVGEPAPPILMTRLIVAGIAELPELASRPVTLAGEIIGILTFLRLIGAVRRVFGGEPEIRDALEERVTEVLIDEIGHLSLNRLLAMPGTFAALRGLLPVLALGTRGALPEAEQLGILPLPVGEALSFDVATLPAEVRRRAFLA